MHDPDPLFRAVADLTRRRLLHLIARRESCVGDLVEILGQPQPTVSRHLAQLRAAGFVTVRRDAQWVHYRLAKPRGAACEALLQAIGTCAQLPEHARDVRRAAALERRGGCCPTAAFERREVSR